MKVSFYVPTYNSEKTIKKCIISILNQSYHPKEIIIIDGDSRDNTLNIVNSLSKNIKIIKRNKSGLANARNLAIKTSKQEVIASIDSDVVLTKDWLEKNLYFLKQKNISAVGGKLIEKTTNIYDKWRSVHMNQDWGEKLKKNPRFLFGSNTIFKKSWLKKAGLYNEKYQTNYEDVDISNRIKKVGGKLIYNPHAISYHHKSDSLKSLLITYWKWHFNSMTKPNNILNLVKRFLFNVYRILRHIILDLIHFRLNFLFIDLFLISSSYYDLKYYLELKK